MIHLAVTHRGKRALEFLLAALLLVVTAPVQAVLALSIVRRMGRPILFRQERIGLDNEPFTLVKFRTMKDAIDPAGRTMSHDDRLTSLGRRLRSTSLDELPTLVNVIRGEMSLVGPRPLPAKYLPRYTRRQAHRHDVRPGVTGWAQVNGRNAISWEQKFELDVWYVDHWSVTLDFKILLMTIDKVFRREGINAGGYAIMPEFKGSPPPSEEPQGRED